MNIKIILISCVFLLISCNNQQNNIYSLNQESIKIINSNQLILNTNDLNLFTIVQDTSYDYDMTSNSHPIVISDEPEFIYQSDYNFINNNKYNTTRINIKISVYTNTRDALNAFNTIKAYRFSKEGNTNTPEKITGVQGGIKKNPMYHKDNPFYSQNINIPKIGTNSFCYQWSSFAPVIVYTYQNIKIEIQENIILSHQNLSVSNANTLSDSIEIAKLQLLKLKKLLGDY